METTEIDTLLSEAWYDTLGVHEFCTDQETLPMCPFNPRNSDEDYDYRLEKLVKDGEVEEDLFDGTELARCSTSGKLQKVSFVFSKTMTVNLSSPNTASTATQVYPF